MRFELCIVARRHTGSLRMSWQYRVLYLKDDTISITMDGVFAEQWRHWLWIRAHLPLLQNSDVTALRIKETSLLCELGRLVVFVVVEQVRKSVYKLHEVSTRTWAVSLDPWPNRTWGCARILFFNSAQACCVHLTTPVQRNYTRERFFSTLTLLDLLTAIGLYMSTCDKITRTKSHVYLELSAKRASVRTHINMHARKNSHTFIFVC